MTAEHVRDAAAAAAVLGFFASAWFGWAQEQPPAAWRAALITGSVVSLLVMTAGGVLAWLHWSDGTAFDPSTGRTFGVIVGIEFAVAGLGAAVLALLHRPDLVPAWVALVVGLHLLPLAPLLAYPLLRPVGALVAVIAVLAVPAAGLAAVPVSAVTGAATGLVLFATALFSLATAIA